MRIRVRSRQLPKEGNAEEDYEDAVWPPAGEREARLFRCAVADGATETSFSGLWARMLVQAYGHGRLGGRRQARNLAALQAAWRDAIGGKARPWYAEEKLRQGAFAALLGLTISSGGTDQPRWRAWAVGDCCLIRLPEHGPMESFPFRSAGEFTSRPNLLATDPRHNDVLGASALRANGPADYGDRFYLMTDALAAWFLASAEYGGCPAEGLEHILASEPACFVPWVDRLRAEGAIRNDDVTLLAVDMS